jgi:hypothetical protein
MPKQPPTSSNVIIKVPTAKAIASADFGTGTDRTRIEITSDLEVAVRGYRAAVQRFVSAVTRCAVDESADVHIALFEALNWLDSIAEGKGALSKGLRGDYRVRGLRFVRGRAHHHWAQATYASATGEWFWQGLDVLPRAPEFHENPGGQKAYTTCLERKPVLASLQHVERLLPASPLG